MTGLVATREAGALWLRLDRPASYNALTGELMVELTEQVRGVADDVRVVVLTGTGPAFCAGADLDAGGADLDGTSVDAANALVRAVVGLDRPVVAGLNGVAAGFGLSLALACDLAVATESASLTLGFGRVGIMPDGGATATITAAVGRSRAMRLALLSERLGATEAFEAGLVSHVFPDDGYAAGLADVVHRLASGAPLAQAATKKAVNAAALATLEPALATERAGQEVLLRTHDAAEGMAAFNQKRPPEFTGR
ncbi:enoyl-CoA hydratase [Nocardioides mangrovicus]|uniref:Enoyl-CoA hydratase n=1 Tax=Nocardioides mangrovicus TaxID=2478913 RepID=A0A3L8P3G6_9ACTN|nr:enoyl-CoA hydratase-related protein [Nocardioides mangrovicus]RLV49795.1 enoyl-CoA hydratase [Nocardioides mangrovicus]